MLDKNVLRETNSQTISDIMGSSGACTRVGSWSMKKEKSMDSKRDNRCRWWYNSMKAGFNGGWIRRQE